MPVSRRRRRTRFDKQRLLLRRNANPRPLVDQLGVPRQLVVGDFGQRGRAGPRERIVPAVGRNVGSVSVMVRCDTLFCNCRCWRAIDFGQFESSGTRCVSASLQSI